MRRAKKTVSSYPVDNKIYSTKVLRDYHLELQALKKQGLIQSFSLPQKDEMIRSKFHAVKAEINGIVFDSLNESRFYLEVLKGVKNKTIRSFELQKRYELIPKYKTRDGRTVRKTEYLADFVLHMPDDSVRVIDVKGVETPVFKIKKKLLEYRYPEVKLECLHYVSGKWMDAETYKNRSRKAEKKTKGS